jgi:hypothetical protein
MAFRLGEKLGIRTDDPQELLKRLRSVDTLVLTKVSHEVLTPEVNVHTCHHFSLHVATTVELTKARGALFATIIMESEYAVQSTDSSLRAEH